MSEQQQILSIIDNLGGRENIKDYYHCATRLRFNLFDYDKINKDALKANPLVLSVVQASGQCQLIIGNKVGAVYSALHGVLETGGQNSALSSSGTAANRESFISRIFAFISGSFLPLIGILAAAGLLRAFTTLLLSLPSLTGNSTLTLLSFIEQIVPAEVTIHDPAPAVISHAASMLNSCNWPEERGQEKYRFYTTGNTIRMKESLYRLLGIHAEVSSLST